MFLPFIFIICFHENRPSIVTSESVRLLLSTWQLIVVIKLNSTMQTQLNNVDYSFDSLKNTVRFSTHVQNINPLEQFVFLV